LALRWTTWFWLYVSPHLSSATLINCRFIYTFEKKPTEQVSRVDPSENDSCGSIGITGQKNINDLRPRPDEFGRAGRVLSSRQYISQRLSTNAD
jgi:hypothetical protein